jgi:hypothetical protein
MRICIPNLRSMSASFSLILNDTSAALVIVLPAVQ